MRSITKKIIIMGAASVVALGVLTACTKTTEKTDDTEAQTEEADDQGEPQEESPESGDADEQDAAGKDGGEGDPSGEEVELEGRITEVPEDSDDSFIITKLETEEENGVSMIADDPDGKKITVVYSIDTSFVKQTVRNGGEDTEEAEGSEADLRKDLLVEMKGSYHDENTFFVTEVTIVEVL